MTAFWIIVGASVFSWVLAFPLARSIYRSEHPKFQDSLGGGSTPSEGTGTHPDGAVQAEIRSEPLAASHPRQGVPRPRNRAEGWFDALFIIAGRPCEHGDAAFSCPDFGRPCAEWCSGCIAHQALQAVPLDPTDEVQR